MSVRLARPDDKDAVVELSKDIYKFSNLQLDYVPVMYERWLSSTNHIVYVCEYHGKVVGMVCFTIIDNGKTCWKEAMRVHESFRGKGLFHQLNNIPHHLPKSVSRIRWTKAGNEDVFCKEFEYSFNPNTKLLENRVVFFISNTVELKETLQSAYQQLFHTSQSSLIHLETAASAYQYLTTRSHLLPGNFITTDWISYEATLNNLIVLQYGGLAL
jgi:hypothetical protein